MQQYNIILASKSNITAYKNEILELEKYSQLSTLWNEKNYLCELDAKWDLSYLLLLDKTLLGVAIVSKKTNFNCHLHRFIIDKDHRKKGLGSFFLEQLKKKLTPEFDCISLFVQSNCNDVISFYKKHKFKPLMQVEENLLMCYIQKLNCQLQ